MIYGLLDAQRVWQESCEKIEEEWLNIFRRSTHPLTHKI